MTDEEMKVALDRAKTSIELTLFRSDGPSHNLYIISTALLASAAREQRMSKVVEWAKRWRTETCSRVLGCDTYDGTHGGECEITRNEREGCTLVDALDAPPGRGE